MQTWRPYLGHQLTQRPITTRRIRYTLSHRAYLTLYHHRAHRSLPTTALRPLPNPSLSLRSLPPAHIMTRKELDIVTAQQLEWLSVFIFIGLFPAAYFMYRHWQSMRRRYPNVPAAGGGKAKVS